MIDQLKIIHIHFNLVVIKFTIIFYCLAAQNNWENRVSIVVWMQTLYLKSFNECFDTHQNLWILLAVFFTLTQLIRMFNILIYRLVAIVELMVWVCLKLKITNKSQKPTECSWSPIKFYTTHINVYSHIFVFVIVRLAINITNIYHYTWILLYKIWESPLLFYFSSLSKIYFFQNNLNLRF